MILFKEEKELTFKDESKHIYHPFLINNKAKALFVGFSYEPGDYDGNDCIERIVEAFSKVGSDVDSEKAKRFLPVNNLLTLSIDGPKGMIGNAHRHESEQKILISEEKAEFGFNPVAIVPGLYTICISTHCIASPLLKYKIIVESID